MQYERLALVGVGFILALTGCYDDTEIEPDGGPADTAPLPCTEGETRACFVEDRCPGFATCRAGRFDACTAPAERCDGLDNDCDGIADEGFAGLGETCEAGQGSCRDRGRVVCAADGTTTTCDARPGDRTTEVCDGVDNDCDGEVDEGLTLGEPCDTGRPSVCGAGLTACVAGDTRCLATLEATTETCNQLDDDCDGRTDEDDGGAGLAEPCYDGPAATEGIGACTAGARTCVDGMFSACLDQTTPADERCDGVDSDCDGATDEGLDCACAPGAREPCYAGPEGTAGLGACRAGTRTCALDGRAWGACVGEVLPSLELCDGIDNDCDGTVDDIDGMGQPCSVGIGACAVDGIRVCDVATGVVACDATAAAPTAESCDGIDNDCDGVVDDLAGAGEPCALGVGACLDRGVMRCDAEAGALACSAVARAPSEETCDGIDNDCDGALDDVPGLGDACAVGLGACQSTARLVCDLAAGTLMCPATAKPGRVEICATLIDDDCDGEVDEGDCQSRCQGDRDCREGELCDAAICLPAACVEAPIIDAPGLYFGTTTGAPSAFAVTCASTGTAPEQLHALALGDYAGRVCADTAGSAFDTVLSVRGECAATGTELACDDDGAGTPRDSQIEFTVEAGRTYTLIVDGFDGARGDYALRVLAGPCPCLGDDDCAADAICRFGACLPSVCGDGRVEGTERCDDGAAQPDDGCAADCAIEPGFDCARTPRACQPGDALQAIALAPADPPAIAGPVGAPDGERFEHACPAGELITGVAYGYDDDADRVTRIRARCATLSTLGGRLVFDPSGTTATAGTAAPSIDRALDCPFGAVVSGLATRAEPGAGLALVCTPLALVDGALVPGEPVITAPLGAGIGRGALPPDAPRADCPEGGVATAQLGRLTDAPVAYGLRCATLEPRCLGPSLCAERGPDPIIEICDDGEDNDRDGAIDCADADCDADPVRCPACAIDVDCAFDRICLAGACVIGCRADADCQPSLLCDDALCHEPSDFDGDGIDDARDADADGDGIPDAIECPALPCADTDGDGRPDRLDLDADGDGLLDAEEAGHGAPYTLGRVDGFVGVNGLLDALETAPDSGAIVYAIADLDGSGVFDFRERPACAEDTDCAATDLCLIGRCASNRTCGDGGRENNGDLALASPIERGAVEDVLLCNPQDVDTYAITICPGGAMTLVARFRHSEGDLNLTLYGVDGSVLDESLSSADEEQVDHANPGVAPLTVYAVASSDSVRPQSYRLVLGLPGCESPCAADDDCPAREQCVIDHCVAEPGCDDDGFEPNDRRASATPLPLDTRREVLRLCRADEDFHAIAVCPGGSLTVDLLFTHAAGDLDLELQAADGTVVAISNGTLDDERARWQNPAILGEPDALISARVYGGLNTYAIEATVEDCADRAACGNDRLDPGEECDDGGIIDGDGCDHLCGIDRFEIVTADATLDGQRFGDGSGDDYVFVADGSARLQVEISDGAGGCPGALRAWLYDDEGFEIAVDGVPGLCPRFDRIVDAGAYRLRVASSDGAAVAAYRLDYRLVRDVSTGGDFTGALELDGDDLYVLVLDEPRDVRFETREADGSACVEGGIDTLITLLDADLMPVDANDDIAPGRCSTLTQRLEAGIWHLRVEEAGRDEAIDYQLGVTVAAIPEAVDDCRLHAPADVTLAPGQPVTVYGRVYEAGRTDATTGIDAFPALRAELGVGADGTDPAVHASWVWLPGEPNPAWDGAAVGEPETDEYQIVLRLPDPAPDPQRRHDYAWRFSVDGGVSYTYCDLDGNGARLPVEAPEAGYDIDLAGDAVTGRAVIDCRDACADIFACGLQGNFVDHDACVYQCARDPGFYNNARCFADRINSPPPPPVFICFPVLAECGIQMP